MNDKKVKVINLKKYNERKRFNKMVSDLANITKHKRNGRKN